MTSAEDKCSNLVTPELQNRLVKIALQIAGDFHIKLDYSHNSIKQVEKILGKVHIEYAKTKNEDGLNGIAVGLAAYIVATIVKNTKEGRWYIDHVNFGEKSFPFYWREAILFPCGWCQKRIFDGEGDNIWSKYNICTMDELVNSTTDTKTADVKDNELRNKLKYFFSRRK